MQNHRPLKVGALSLLTSLLLMAGPALARDEGLTSQCQRYSTSYDRTYCTAKLFLASDQELNEVYKKLRASVQGDTRQRLTQVQRGWISHRNQSCEGGTGQIDVDCNYRVNRDRTTYLRDRLRECQTGSCNTGLIGQESW